MKYVPPSVLTAIFAVSLVFALSVATSVIAASDDSTMVKNSKSQAENGDGINGGNARNGTDNIIDDYSNTLKSKDNEFPNYIYNFIDNILLPILPGLVVLLVFSTFFSTINFLSGLSEEQQPIRRAYWYLVVWITVNYLLSLMILLLIIPDNVNFGDIDRTFLIYCLLATALPEISSNIRFQMGKTSQSIDLHKYKEKVSDLISQRLNRATNEERSRALESIVHIFSDRLADFKQRLNLLSLESDLTPEENSSLMNILNGPENSDDLNPDASVASIMSDHQVLIPRLLVFFVMILINFKSLLSQT